VQQIVATGQQAKFSVWPIYNNMRLRKPFRKSKSGFTLIELLVAATIISVLAAIGIVSYQSANQRARNSKRQADMEQVRAALEIYRTDNSAYPTSGAWSTLMTDLGSYLSSTNINDPKNITPYVYTYSSDGITYSVCAALEDDATPFCLSSP
jgi:general secretion pathway protein G